MLSEFISDDAREQRSVFITHLLIVPPPLPNTVWGGVFMANFGFGVDITLIADVYIGMRPLYSAGV